MPSRAITLAIILLWLAATGWMAYRELWQKVGQPPPFALELADEVGAQVVPWEIEQNGRPAGTLITSVKRTRERVFELNCVSKPTNLTFRGLPVSEVNSTYRVTARGALRGLRGQVTFPVLLGWRLGGEVEGIVEGGFFRPPGGSGQEGGATAVAANGKVLNALHPLHGLTGLSEGQTWRVPLLDLPASALGSTLTVSEAEASVRLAELPGQDRPVACWCVEYRQGERVAARVWARKPDGTVLRQEALYPGSAIVLQRRVFR
jgi:hypothetical protein